MTARVARRRRVRKETGIQPADNTNRGVDDFWAEFKKLYLSEIPHHIVGELRGRKWCRPAMFCQGINI